MNIDREFEKHALSPLPELEPNVYEVVVSKDGYQSQVVFTGTKEECREKLNQINRVYGRPFGCWGANEPDYKFLRDDRVAYVQYSRNQKQKLNSTKPPRGGSGLK